jgi:hypothetical protein
MNPTTAADVDSTAAARNVHMRILAASCFLKSVGMGFVLTRKEVA